jgi:hypothetical protein
MLPGTQPPQRPHNLSLVLLISAGIVVLWVIPVIVMLSEAGTPGVHLWGFFSIFALPATLLFPLAYGWYSRDSTGAILIGVLPFLLVTGISKIFFSPPISRPDLLLYSIAYSVSLILISGLLGFFAAKKTAGSLLIAVVLAGMWTGIFLTGIH